MSASRLALHGESAASAGLAAAICMAVTQLIGMIVAPNDIAGSLLYGLSLSCLAFGGTYAGVFFVSLAIRVPRRGSPWRRGQHRLTGIVGRLSALPTT